MKRLLLIAIIAISFLAVQASTASASGGFGELFVSKSLQTGWGVNFVNSALRNTGWGERLGLDPAGEFSGPFVDPIDLLPYLGEPGVTIIDCPENETDVCGDGGHGGTTPIGGWAGGAIIIIGPPEVAIYFVYHDATDDGGGGETSPYECMRSGNCDGDFTDDYYAWDCRTSGNNCQGRQQ